MNTLNTFSTTNLAKELRDYRFCRILKYTQIIITKNGTIRGWLIPKNAIKPEDVTILQFLPAKTFKGQIGYQIDRLRQEKLKRKTTVVVGIVDSENELLCYLSIEKLTIPEEYCSAA